MRMVHFKSVRNGVTIFNGQIDLDTVPESVFPRIRKRTNPIKIELPQLQAIKALWAEFHKRYGQWPQPGITDDDNAAWLIVFSKRLQDTNLCNCRRQFTDWMIKNPFRPVDAFAWSVEAHNAINAARHLPLLTVDHARLKYLASLSPDSASNHP